MSDFVPYKFSLSFVHSVLGMWNAMFYLTSLNPQSARLVRPRRPPRPSLTRSWRSAVVHIVDCLGIVFLLYAYVRRGLEWGRQVIGIVGVEIPGRICVWLWNCVFMQCSLLLLLCFLFVSCFSVPPVCSIRCPVVSWEQKHCGCLFGTTPV